MELNNRYPDNYFAEVEQAAFSPANVVPGIGFSIRFCKGSHTRGLKAGGKIPMVTPRFGIASFSADSNAFSDWFWEVANAQSLRQPGLPGSTSSNWTGAIPKRPMTAGSGASFLTPS
jgi:hypothetical protein